MAETKVLLAKAMEAAWAEAAPGLPRSTSAFTGASAPASALPRQVLLFSRTSFEALQRGARSSFQHRRFVLILNAGGPGAVGLDGRWKRLDVGSALLVFPYQVHTYGRMPSRGLRWLFLTFEAEPPAGWERLRGRPIPLSAETWGWAAAAARRWRREATQAEELPWLAGLIVAELARTAKKLAPPEAETSGAAAGQWLPRVHAAVHRPREPLWRVKDIARFLHVSEPHLRAMFRAETGESLGKFLRKVRLSRATALLAAGGGAPPKIGEIARLCGYESPYSFSRAFRRALGKTARDYRREAGARG